MNALWALRPCKAFGRSFYKASVPYPQVACSPSRRTKNNTPLIELAKVWRGCRIAVVWVAASCSDFVRPPSCILCTFMNALWALRPCKAFGRSFYKASVPYPQVACSPSRRTKNNTPLVERGIIFGADGGGRTRTVLLPTDFESVTSANSITSAYKMCCKTALHNGNSDFTV